MRRIRIEIPGRPPTPNARMGWQAQMGVKKKWRELAYQTAIEAISLAGWELEEIELPPSKSKKAPTLRVVAAVPIQYAASLTIIVVVPTAVDRDWDNLVASTKHCTDGIVQAGILVKDSIRHIGDRRVMAVHRAGLSMLIYEIEEGQAPGTFGI